MVHVQKIVDRIKFSLFSPEMIRKMSSAKIIVPDTYDDDGYPIDGGLVDTRLGVVDPGLRCKTCGGRVKECPGHFGHLELVRPVTHVGFAKHILFVLKSTCPNCKRRIVAKELVSEIVQEVEKEVSSDIVVPPVSPAPAEAAASSVTSIAPAVPAQAPAESSVLSELVTDEITGEEKKKKTRKKTVTKKCNRCGTVIPEIKLLKPVTYYKDKEVLLPTDIRDWLASIPDDDLRDLGFDPLYSRPEWMIITALPVPPVSVRPSITLETGERSEDDITHKLVDIIRINQKLEANINAGAPQLIIEDLWELLQYHVITYFDNETANIPPARHRSGRPLKTLAQRLKGKEGRFRYNLSGKRVNFSARTVISPDPNLKIDEVGIPKAMAEELTVPMRVTEWNLEQAKAFISSSTYPKGVYLIRPDGKRLRVGDDPELKKELVELVKVGWILERHIIDGDVAIFNRQPSLHRISMMAHEIRVVPGRTFRLNPVVIPPYNADFDGDEMNIHIIQTEEAQAEARYLMKVGHQLLSPRHGHAVIKPQEDHVSGLYFLTREDREFTKEEAANLLYSIGITEFPESDRKNGKYSGRLLFSQLLPSNLSMKIQSKMGEEIVISKGKLTKGAIDSKAIENAILEHIFISEGADFATDFLNRVTRLALLSISTEGLSVSLKQYTLSEKAEEFITKTLNKSDREVDNLIMQYKNKTLERSPGMSLKETLEALIIQITSQTREDVGKIVEDDLTKENSSIIMAKIGARGSLLNAIQMSALVAQQTVRSKRLKRGYKKRLLPYFKPGVLAPKDRGFVYSSFKRGLTAYEYIHCAMGGREALVNTAIRTARSGYMQRRLINALQDLVVYDDYSVRNADMSVVQFTYGGDAKDPMLASKAEAVDTAKQDDVDTA